MVFWIKKLLGSQGGSTWLFLLQPNIFWQFRPLQRQEVKLVTLSYCSKTLAVSTWFQIQSRPKKWFQNQSQHKKWFHASIQCNHTLVGCKPISTIANPVLFSDDNFKRVSNLWVTQLRLRELDKPAHLTIRVLWVLFSDCFCSSIGGRQCCLQGTPNLYPTYLRMPLKLPS